MSEERIFLPSGVNPVVAASVLASNKIVFYVACGRTPRVFSAEWSVDRELTLRDIGAINMRESPKLHGSAPNPVLPREHKDLPLSVINGPSIEVNLPSGSHPYAKDYPEAECAWHDIDTVLGAGFVEHTPIIEVS